MKFFQRIVASLPLLFSLAIAQSTWSGWQPIYDNFKSKPTVQKSFEYLQSNPNDCLQKGTEDFQSRVTLFNAKWNRTKQEQEFRVISNYLATFSTSDKWSKVNGAESIAKNLKSKPEYQTKKELDQANWLNKVLDRLKNLKAPKSEPPSIQPPKIPEWVGTALNVFFVTLALLAVALLIWLFTKVRWGNKSKRSKSGGLLGDEEDVLSEDEYITIADELASNGQYREACRALYLAILLRIDLAKVARFERSETNWEHLRRIQKSSSKPEGLNIRPITKEFDHVWYGFRHTTAENVSNFKNTYLEVKLLLQGDAS
jgi:hypothetical protein